MKNVFLCGHTGSINRGCEAIVRSTVKLLGVRSGDIFLASMAPQQDVTLSKNVGINLIPYGKYSSKVYRYACGFARKVLKVKRCGADKVLGPIVSQMKSGDLCLSIGGDTYCYGHPWTSEALNFYTYRNHIDNILWCCSIEPDVIKGALLADLKRYKYIFAREQLTYDALIDKGFSKKQVIKCCDPAFFLDAAPVALPQGFALGNTVGINVSEVVASDNSLVYSNIVSTIRYILEQTSMSVCLIPHVYSIQNMQCDYPILRRLYDEIGDARVSIVDKEYSCEQLKYIISKCRFFIGARTHATIAAYSSFVPTLVIGYSVKSKGIATDLFGSYKGYVLPYKDISREDELLIAFEHIVENETEIRERLITCLPAYKKQLIDAVSEHIALGTNASPITEICKKQLCTGCSACANVCPQSCIKMVADEEGFEYPVIEDALCISCKRCIQTCPSANKTKDSGEIPDVFAIANRDEKIRLESSSGGLFSIIAENILRKGGVVFGSAFTEKFGVRHESCQSTNELQKLRGSKYVQSQIGNCYQEVRRHLDAGRAVLFCGTPCQVSGLLAFLGGSQENLFTVDFICHGVPSPKIWKKYLIEKEKEYASKIKCIKFRDKTNGWKLYSLSIEFANEACYCSKVTDDPYLRAFVSNAFLRPSCANCSFKQVHRQSDLTIGDFWGIEKIGWSRNDDRGTSLLMVHSSKGRELFKQIEKHVVFEQMEYAFALEHNKSYLESAVPSPFRDRFFQKNERITLEKLVATYHGKGICSKIRRFLARKFS